MPALDRAGILLDVQFQKKQRQHTPARAGQSAPAEAAYMRSAARFAADTLRLSIVGALTCE